ncbi:FHA domain-containing protein [Chitinophaga sp. Hz27]|uniref:FHA domain-containing protein n=1 Tax=Chitinophaga sp. Hz27 TaxID=3347169 RepID=UPI0035DC2E14
MRYLLTIVIIVSMYNRLKVVCPQCHQDNYFDRPSERPAACKNCGAPLASTLPVHKPKTPIGISVIDNATNEYFDLKFFEMAFFGREHMGQRLFGNNNTISRRHFLIKLSNNQYWIQDVGSSGGTFYQKDGELIECKEPVLLEDGGTVLLGDAPFTIKILY